MKKQTLKPISLSLIQRIVLSNSLPQEGGFTQMIILRSIRKKIEITEKDVKDFEIKDAMSPSGPTIQYNLKKAAGKLFNYSFDDGEKAEIRKGLQVLINKSKMNESLLDLAIELKCTDKPVLKKVDEEN